MAHHIGIAAQPDRCEVCAQCQCRLLGGGHVGEGCVLGVQDVALLLRRTVGLTRGIGAADLAGFKIHDIGCRGTLFSGGLHHLPWWRGLLSLLRFLRGGGVLLDQAVQQLLVGHLHALGHVVALDHAIGAQGLFTDAVWQIANGLLVRIINRRGRWFGWRLFGCSHGLGSAWCHSGCSPCQCSGWLHWVNGRQHAGRHSCGLIAGKAVYHVRPGTHGPA